MVKALIMSGYGINCEEESSYAFELAGASSKIVHVNDLIAGKDRMEDYDILMFPGGFSYGDDTGSGNAFAGRIKNNLWEQLMTFVGSGKLILGVCNGFQVMTHLGLFSLPGTEYGQRINALLPNTQARYECRWVHIKALSQRCIFTKGIKLTNLPIAHGEGRFYCSEKTLEGLRKNDQIVFTYADGDGIDAKGAYPLNPNGAISDIAGICDRTGRIMGMMPHPERAIFAESDPLYHLKREMAKRQEKKVEPMIMANLQIFRNAVDFCKKGKCINA